MVEYCVEGCGRRAVRKRPLGMMSDGSLVSEWVCEHCAERGEPIMRIVKDGETMQEKIEINPAWIITPMLVMAGVAIAWGGWWWVLAVPLILVGVVGMTEEINKGKDGRC